MCAFHSFLFHFRPICFLIKIFLNYLGFFVSIRCSVTFAFAKVSYFVLNWSWNNREKVGFSFWEHCVDIVFHIVMCLLVVVNLV